MREDLRKVGMVYGEDNRNSLALIRRGKALGICRNMVWRVGKDLRETGSFSKEELTLQCDGQQQLATM